MSVLKNKRHQSKMEYVTNGYSIEKYSIDFVKRLSVKNARIFQTPVTRLAMLQSDTAYLSNEWIPKNQAEFQIKKIFLGISMAALHVLDKRMADIYEILMIDPAHAFCRQNGKPIPQAEAERILDNLSYDLGNMIDKQDKLLAGVRKRDGARFKNLPPADPTLSAIISELSNTLSNSIMNLFI